MKIRILGSAAAEGIPAVWCCCDTCRKAKQMGGKELRMRTSYLIDDDTIVDFGPDGFPQSLKYNIDLLKIRRIIYTHVHKDHLNTLEFWWRWTPGYFSRVDSMLEIIGSKYIRRDVMKERIDPNVTVPKDLLLEFRVTEDGKWLTSGDMEIYSVPAEHAPATNAQCQVIRRGSKTFFVCHDTGFLSEEAWKMLEGIKMDAVVIDCTSGISDGNGYHMGGKYVIATRDRLVEMGCLAKDGIAIANHFTHNAGVLHDELRSYFEPKGFLVGYDGMEIDL